MKKVIMKANSPVSKLFNKIRGFDLSKVESTYHKISDTEILLFENTRWSSFTLPDGGQNIISDFEKKVPLIKRKKSEKLSSSRSRSQKQTTGKQNKIQDQKHGLNDESYLNENPEFA